MIHGRARRPLQPRRSRAFRGCHATDNALYVAQGLLPSPGPPGGAPVRQGPSRPAPADPTAPAGICRWPRSDRRLEPMPSRGDGHDLRRRVRRAVGVDAAVETLDYIRDLMGTGAGAAFAPIPPPSAGAPRAWLRKARDAFPTCGAPGLPASSRGTIEPPTSSTRRSTRGWRRRRFPPRVAARSTAALGPHRDHPDVELHVRRPSAGATTSWSSACSRSPGTFRRRT